MLNHEIEQWNQEYEAFNFEFNGIKFKSRLAKKLLKRGYFVACWRKNETNKNRPFNCKDSKDKLIINILDRSKKANLFSLKSCWLKKGLLVLKNTKVKWLFVFILVGKRI